MDAKPEPVLAGASEEVAQRRAERESYLRHLHAAANDAAAGAHVLWIAHRLQEARMALDDVVERTGVTPATVRRAKGQERVEYATGGWIRFVSTDAAMRGLTVDFVVLHDASEDAARAARYCLGGTPHPHAAVRTVSATDPLARLVVYLHDQLGIEVQPWQLRFLELALTGDRSTERPRRPEPMSPQQAAAA